MAIIIPKAIIQPRLQYTDKTFEDLRQSLITLVQTTPSLKDKWTDFNESDIAMALLELWCAIGDELNFFLDNQANEAFWLTARQRKSVIGLAKLIAYKLDTSVSAAGEVDFTWVSTSSVTATSPVPIPKYTRLRTSGGTIGLPYVTTEAATLAQGASVVTVPVMQGVLFEEEFLASNVPEQRLTLGRTDIASNFGAIEVLIGQGDDIDLYEQWTEAENFIITSPESNQKIFVVETNHLDQTILKFGDGNFGQIPPDGFTIVVRYLASLGAIGNTGAFALDTIEDQITDIDGNLVSLSVLNHEACVGGADRETIEHAKRQAPLEFAALYRAVTRIDGAALIDGLAGIAKANVWGEQELAHPDIKHFNQMYTCFIADGINPEMGAPASWLPTTSLKNLVTDFLEDRKIITTKVNIVEPEFVFVDVQIDAYLEKTASTVSVKQLIVDKLEEFFDITNRDFGQEVRYSNLIRELDSIPNVDHVKLKLRRNGVRPSRDDVFGGTLVTVTGSGFQAGATVHFDLTPATSVTVVNSKTITCVVPPTDEARVVDVKVTNPDASTYILRKGFIYAVDGNAPIETSGTEPNPDDAQFNFDDQDIYIRRHEIAALGNLVSEDGTENIMHYAKDDDFIHAGITFNPFYTRLGEVATFDGTGSSSPNAVINKYTWNMGARGVLMVRQADGSIVPHGTQPEDEQIISTTITELRNIVMWKYTERPSTGYVTVVLTIQDTTGKQAATAVSYEIKL